MAMSDIDSDSDVDYGSDEDYNDDLNDQVDAYDAYDHMISDPVDFQMHGYGGFGYDTSHVAPDSSKPTLTLRAEEGDLSNVRRIVEEAAAVSPSTKNATLNSARRWTEVDYRMSGFTKEYEWFDATPLAAAAFRGHHDVVRYLLEEGADPTLKGCPEEDVHFNALEGAILSLDKCRRTAGQGGGTGAGGKDGVVLRGSQCCVDLLKAAAPFWKDASYSSSRYSKTARNKFNNAPMDPDGLLAAVGAVPALVEVPSPTKKENGTDRK